MPSPPVHTKAIATTSTVLGVEVSRRVCCTLNFFDEHRLRVGLCLKGVDHEDPQGVCCVALHIGQCSSNFFVAEVWGGARLVLLQCAKKCPTWLRAYIYIVRLAASLAPPPARTYPSQHCLLSSFFVIDTTDKKCMLLLCLSPDRTHSIWICR